MPTADARPDPASTPAGSPSVEVATVGETMVVLCPAPGEPLEHAERVAVSVGGAESNVAGYLARLGHRATWVSRVGDDPFGRAVVRHVAAAGVRVDLVTVDPAAPTGLYVKDPGPAATEVHYYRAGSAASRMDPGALADERLAGARVLHLSGITAALSASCRALAEHAVTDRPLPGALVSFDVNHRARLWPADRAASVLRDLADRSDLVFVGQDEADALWGTADPAAVRRLLPRPETVVVKDGAVGATALRRDADPIFVPAPQVAVVEPVGAGDAFAAGYLAGLLRGVDTVRRLRLGHLVAAQALGSSGDNAPVPPWAWFDQLLDAPVEAWSPLDLLSRDLGWSGP
ncbi:sugar kinase [Micromonospora cremea]|uniref:2-dehydro-3-deoxygluconokinase n=1 Tax=Micromonospora cremea TaxID=709881 RepID=A0A1N5VZN6_9ACTN|nr:sugar kinase [Micromonospora cremea]SIM78411.1 2-dehydro-3-deoxygluconokinase [Micromonospora cremea]